jgi:excisionase family DNA binding protein
MENNTVEPSNEQHTNTRLLTADDLSERWGCPRAHVYRLSRSGHLPTVRLGKYRRWRQDAVEAFECDGGTE